MLRVYHAGRDPSHRARERALVKAGIDVTLVVPREWPEAGAQASVPGERLDIRELDVVRPGDVNRHAYADRAAISRLVAEIQPDLVDVHEEPFSLAARQWLSVLRDGVPVTMYTAQNIDKRLPPPFAQYERAAFRRAGALYPCSAQAASVARGKGFDGLIQVLPLGYDDAVFFPGKQSLEEEGLILAFIGRLVPEKGILDAIGVLARVLAMRPARLVVVGSGREERHARDFAASLGVLGSVDFVGWQPSGELARTYRATHFVLVPSRLTATWVEQFGRVVVEAQASGAVVAGYATGAIPEVAGDASVLAEAGALADLSQSLLGVAADPAVFARLRQMGIERSRSRTWEHVAELQSGLYHRVIGGRPDCAKLPLSPRTRRAAACAEFGRPAPTASGQRPFALPLLSAGGQVSDALGKLIDTAGEIAARAGALMQSGGGPLPDNPTAPGGRVAVSAARATRLFVTYLPPRRRGIRVAELTERWFGTPRARLPAPHVSGYSISCDLRDGVQRAIFYCGTYEPKTSRLIAGELRPGETFLDVGANVGHFTFLAARIVGPNGSVYAVEASPSTAEFLRRDVERNRLEHVVTVVSVAAMDRSYETTLYAHENPDSIGMRHLNDPAGVAIEIVQAVPLDRALPAIRPAVVKVDVEGADFRALVGMKRILDFGHPRLVVVETEDAHLTRFGDSVADIIRFMSELGYESEEIEEPWHTPSHAFRPRE